MFRKFFHKRAYKAVDKKMRNVRRMYHARAIFNPSNPDNVWDCHVCLRTRPDMAIGVLQRRHHHDDGVVITENVRYCNDRYDCASNAHLVFFTEQQQNLHKDESMVIISDRT